jgi:hypothetical protein
MRISPEGDVSTTKEQVSGQSWEQAVITALGAFISAGSGAKAVSDFIWINLFFLHFLPKSAPNLFSQNSVSFSTQKDFSALFPLCDGHQNQRQPTGYHISFDAIRLSNGKWHQRQSAFQCSEGTLQL